MTFPYRAEFTHHDMRKLLVLLAGAFLSLCPAEAPSTNSVYTNDVARLRVTVVDSVLLSSFRGSLNRIGDLDPRFAVTLRIDSCVPALTNLQPGTVVTFEVHSPSQFLRGSARKGMTHEITLPRKRAMDLIVGVQK